MLRSRINVASIHCRAVFPSPSRAILSPACPSSSRLYSSPSTPRSKPAAAMAQASSGYEPGVMYSTAQKAEAEPHRFNVGTHYPLGLHQPVMLPAPLPTDITPVPGSLHDDLYRSTSAIDTVSILAICSTRPEFVPRAYLIFTQMLDNVKRGVERSPEAKVWAVIIKAMVKLGKPEDTGFHAGRKAELWRHRAEKVVQEWEALSAASATPAKKSRRSTWEPALQRQGILIYRAYFAGVVEAGLDLDPMIKHLEHPDIGVKNLVDGFSQEFIVAALDQVKEFAIKNSRPHLIKEIEAILNVETHTRAFQERLQALEAVPTVNPVPDNKQKARSATEDGVPVIREDAHNMMPQGRFAINNLRDTLEKINTPLSNHSRQLGLEKASYDAAEEELRHSAKLLEEAGVQGVQRLQRGVLQGHMYRWHQRLTPYLEKEIKRMQAELTESDAKDASAPRWSASIKLKDSTLLLYLSVLPPKKLALITILELMRTVGSGGIADGMKTLRGCIGVGKAVEAEHRADTIRNVAGSGSAIWHKALDAKSLKPDRSAISKVWSEIGRDREDRLRDDPSASLRSPEPGLDPRADLAGVWTPPWTQMVQMSLGSYLVEALIQTAKVERTGVDPETGDTVKEMQPAFNHTYEYVRGKKLGVIRLNPAVADRLASDSVRTMIHAKHLPMLVPPRPWEKWNSGAYLTARVAAMRFKDSIEQMNYLQDACNQGHLNPVFKGLDVLSSTPWRINRQVFDVVLEAWNNGDAIGDIPAAPEKTHYNVPDELDPRESDPAVRSLYHERKKAVSLAMRKDHGERCKYNYNLEIARSYLNDTFYIPHNMDFRGRAYPIPPHLSPVGDDLCRGLLTFGVKKPLGTTGLKWLQIHLANVYGFDKASFEDRAQFAVTNREKIFESADKPLTGSRWWLEAEDPWQCLATCFELAAALRSADPTKFESSLPVHQDGTCNGMQHYAALGGDVRGAKAVNLEKGDRPADIYSGVADLVNASILEDQKNGDPVASTLQLPLGRKVVKQTVMTTVYGVTFIGAREQIAKQLQARGDMNVEEVYVASTYVAHKVLDSIGDLFSGARAIQDWLTFAARLAARSISPQRLEDAFDMTKPGNRATKKNMPTSIKSRLAKELMTAVVWTSPLGLPVVQPYRKEVKKQIMTSLQTVYISDPNVQSEVSPQKQATAFPPNYIHSLDATHMLLTAGACYNKEITFASVHDSYWTHAATVESMSENIRDTFIHLHSGDLINRLHDEFLERYGKHYIPINSGSKLLADAKKQRKATKARTQAKAKAAAAAESAESAELADADAEDADSLGSEEGLNLEELSGDIPIHTVGNQRFVRFSDVLPPTPPRGQFDVQRIRDSQYFFS